MRIDSRHCKRRSHRLNIDADNPGSLIIQMQKCRLASAWQMAGCSLYDPTLGNELFHDGRDRASLEARTARQTRSRNGLMLANQIEHDPPVDITGRLASRHSKVI